MNTAWCTEIEPLHGEGFEKELFYCSWGLCTSRTSTSSAEHPAAELCSVCIRTPAGGKSAGHCISFQRALVPDAAPSICMQPSTLRGQGTSQTPTSSAMHPAAEVCIPCAHGRRDVSSTGEAAS